ncbi:MAG: radical SAM protein [Bacteriovoracaceae bacterium]|nr:radical SAM protein [Bacteriovoracaceae bacterium]
MISKEKHAIIVNLSTFPEESYTVGPFSVVRTLTDLGVSTDYFDNSSLGFDFSKEEFKGVVFKALGDLINENTKFIGFSILTANADISIECGEFIKKYYPQITVGFGGAFFGTSSFDEYYKKKMEGFDFFIKGKSDEILGHLVSWGFNPSLFTPLLGFNFITENGYTYSEGQSVFESYRPFSYIPYGNRPDYIETSFSVGCPYRCSFCSQHFHYPNFIRSDVEDCINELRPHKNKKAFFTDALINNNHKWLEKFCHRLIEEKLNIQWQCWFRVSRQMNNLELLTLLYDSGCRVISFGLESASSSVLKHMKKFHDEKQIYEIFEKIRLLNKAGKFMTVKLNIIAGYPTESEIDFNKTYYFLKVNSDIISEVSINPALINLDLKDFKKMDDAGGFSWNRGINDWATKESTPAIRLKRLKRLRDLMVACGKTFYIYQVDDLAKVIDNQALEKSIGREEFSKLNPFEKILKLYKGYFDNNDAKELVFPTLDEADSFFKYDYSNGVFVTSAPTSINKLLSRGREEKFKVFHYLNKKIDRDQYNVYSEPINILSLFLLKRFSLTKNFLLLNKFFNRFVPAFSFHTLFKIKRISKITTKHL